MIASALALAAAFAVAGALFARRVLLLNDPLKRLEMVYSVMEGELDPSGKLMRASAAPEAKLAKARMVLYTWQVDGGQVYVDFHGHDPSLGDKFWVRYSERDLSEGFVRKLIKRMRILRRWTLHRPKRARRDQQPTLPCSRAYHKPQFESAHRST